MATGGRRRGWLAALCVALGCAEDPGAPVTAAGDAGCSWGRCDASGPRCVATGVADGRWLTTDWEERPGGAPCSRVPEALWQAETPGRYLQGDGPIGEIRCEGLQMGAVTLRVRVRVGLLSASGATDLSCHCNSGWDVALLLLVEGQEATSLGMLRSGEGVDDPSCQRGPDQEYDVRARVGADGRLAASLELGRCYRAGRTACVFRRGTGITVLQ